MDNLSEIIRLKDLQYIKKPTYLDNTKYSNNKSIFNYI